MDQNSRLLHALTHVPTGCSACPTKFANYNAVLPNVRLQRRARHITKSQRDFASKPKVVSNELPWVNFATRPNSNGVAAFTNTHRTTSLAILNQPTTYATIPIRRLQACRLHLRLRISIFGISIFGVVTRIESTRQ